jgi:lipopolysaccharide transport system permease protein
MLLFLFVFGVVFKTRLGDTYQMPRDYTVYILSGLVPWLSILPTLTNACNSITGNAGLVKQFVFHIEILPAKDVLTTSVTWLVGTVVVSTYTLVRYETLPWTYVLLPIVAVLHIISMVGIAFLLSATTVFMRDLKDFVIIFGNAGIYLLPVVYLPEWVPDALRPMLYVNPFSYPIWVYQDVTYFGRIEHPIAWIVNGILSVAVFAFGFRVFRKLRPFFGSAL